MQPTVLNESTTVFPCLTRATTTDPNPPSACRELFDQLGRSTNAAMVFVGDGYDLSALEGAMLDEFSGDLVGCTTAGIIGEDGFESFGMSAIGFRAPAFAARTFLIDDLLDSGACLNKIAAYVDDSVQDLGPTESIFAVLLIDGLSMAEERVVAALSHALGDVPLVGGSAGDHLKFESTRVLHDGQFRESIATVSIIRSESPISVFRHQHHSASPITMVITDADPNRRRVFTINGRPAASAYANAVDVPVESLIADPDIIAAHPLVLLAGGRSFIRSVHKVNTDGSLDFSCAIDEGLVLRLGNPDERIASFRETLRCADAAVGGAEAILTFDCTLRRSEFERAGLASLAGRLFSQARAVGFSTYGEQIDGLHVNQTLVGVAIGGR